MIFHKLNTNFFKYIHYTKFLRKNFYYPQTNSGFLHPTFLSKNPSFGKSNLTLIGSGLSKFKKHFNDRHLSYSKQVNV